MAILRYDVTRILFWYSVTRILLLVLRGTSLVGQPAARSQATNRPTNQQTNQPTNQPTFSLFGINLKKQVDVEYRTTIHKRLPVEAWATHKLMEVKIQDKHFTNPENQRTWTLSHFVKSFFDRPVKIDKNIFTELLTITSFSFQIVVQDGPAYLLKP